MVWALLGAQPALASHGEPHATIKTWAIGDDPIINGLDPHETFDDIAGLTNHVGSPTIVTIMENTEGGSCGILFWNPETNEFKSFALTGGLNTFGDIDRSSPDSHGSGFGGGDTWSLVNGNSSFTPYVNFRGTTSFRRWNAGVSSGTGLRVNPANGLVYFGNFTDPGQLIELNPQTNATRVFITGSQPYQLALDGSGNVYMTATAGGGEPDQILRLNPSTNVLRRWNVPGAMNFQDSFTLGTPNGITVDPEGNVWFSESESNELGRLNPSTNVIDEYAKPGLLDPQSIAASGTGTRLQAFFTEAGDSVTDPGHISLLTTAQATPNSTTVMPTDTTLNPTGGTATPTDQTKTAVTATITPETFDSPGVDPSGILRFPISPTTDKPTGMTKVALPNTVFGSMEGSHHVFRLESEAIIADDVEPEPEPDAATGRCSGSDVTIAGTSGPDEIHGTTGPDVIRGGKGKDRIFGARGPDKICGNRGRDLLNGGRGSDIVRGNKHKDRVRGKRGDDRLHGDSGIDRLHGGTGDDFLQGGNAFDRCIGGPGDNIARSCQAVRQARRVHGRRG